MKNKLTKEEIIELRKNRTEKLNNELNEIKEQSYHESVEASSYIELAHNLYVLNCFNNDDEDGKRLRSLRNELFSYCVDHMKKYKVLMIELKETRDKIKNKKISDEKYTKKLTK